MSDKIDSYDKTHLLLDQADALATLMGYRPQKGLMLDPDTICESSHLMQRLLREIRDEVRKLYP